MRFGHPSSAELEALARGNGASEHAGSCPDCQRKLARARARLSLLGAPRPYTLTDATFDRVERALFSTPIEPARSRLRWALPALGVALAAAALAFVFARPAPVTPAPAVAVAPPRPVEPVAPHKLGVAVVLVQGACERREAASDAWEALGVGSELRAGVSIRTGTGRLALRTPAGTVLLLASGAMATLEADERLRLADGEVSVEARAGFSLATGRWLLESTSSSYLVARAAPQTVVSVAAGEVWVAEQSAPARRTHLVAPLRARWSDEAGPEAASREPWSSARPFEGWGEPPWVQLDVDELPVGAQVQVDELGWGPLPLSGLLAAGAHRVRAQVNGEPLRDGWVTLAPGGGPTRFAPPKPAPKAKRAREELDPTVRAALSKAVREHLPELRACYQQWLKRDFTAAGAVTLTLETERDGTIADVSLDGARLTRDASRCFVEEAATWALPPLEVDRVEIPLVLTPDGR